MQRGGRDNDLISFLEFCNSTSDLQVDLNFRDDVLADAQGDPPLQNDVGQDDVLAVAQGDPPLQNDNRNLIQNQNQNQNPNPNPSLLNQNQEHGLFEGMHIHPNFNNLMEPRYQPYYQLNPELCMPSNQNYMARPPSPYTNVTNVASISRGEADISRSSRRRRHGTIMNRPTYNGTGNSASEPMQQNIEGFVRITRMRADPGQPMSNPDLASNTLLIPLARINTTLRQPMSYRALASNALSIPLARPNPNPGQLITLAFNPLSIPSPNLSPMQITPETAPAISGRVTSQSWSVALLSSDHELAQFRAMVPELAGLTNQRTTSHQQPVRAIASSDAYQLRRTRSQPYEVYQYQSYQVYQPHQVVPVLTIPSVPASSALSVSVPDHTASTLQTGNSGTLWPGRREMLDEMLDGRVIDRHRDMRLDIEHMSHEELVELEERIGSVSTGVSEEIVNARMQQRPFSALLENETDPCCICQEEYVENDQVGTLDCGHNFHRECIKKWLGQKNICPFCKKPGIDT